MGSIQGTIENPHFRIGNGRFHAGRRKGRRCGENQAAAYLDGVLQQCVNILQGSVFIADKLNISTGDAFLSFITLYGYEAVNEKTTSELQALIAKSWEEFVLLGEETEVELKMKPNQKKKSLLDLLHLPTLAPQKLKIAFIYEKTPGTSAWTYAHELGRLHLQQTFPEEVQTVCYENGTLENIDALLEIFSLSPPFSLYSALNLV